MTSRYSTIEIDGQSFIVIAEKESESDDGLFVTVVLWMTPQELASFRQLYQQIRQSIGQNKLPTCRVRRIGIDQLPIEFQLGSYNWWSRHDVNGMTHYKQLVRLLPATQPLREQNAPLLTPLLDHEILGDVVLDLSARFEILLNALAMSNTISPEVQSTLATGEWMGIAPVDQHREDELRWRQRRVEDAEVHLVNAVLDSD